MKLKYINTGKPVSLKDLIISSDIHPDAKIQIFDKAGAFVAAGNIYQDHVLDYMYEVGIATKAGTGLTVKFQFV